MEAFVTQGWAARNDRGDAAFRKGLNSFVTDHDTLTAEEIEASPIYRDFFRPRGLGWSIGTSIVPMTGDVLVLSFERSYDRGPVEVAVKDRLDPLRPHLARSAFTAARFGLERARGMVSGLNVIGLAAAVVTSSGTMIAGNAQLEDMSDVVLQGAFDRISLADPAAHRALSLALKGLARGSGHPRPPMTFAMRPSEGQPVVAHLIPLVATARDIFARGDALLILSRIGQGSVPGTTLLEAVFDLTPAESRVARKVLEGMPTALIAESLCVSNETVRTQMKAVFRKTGVARQVDLVRLVSGLPNV
jgi:DNA-binding CsgD family transcriptional regulator